MRSNMYREDGENLTEIHLSERELLEPMETEG